MLNGVNGRQEALETDRLFATEETSDEPDFSDDSLSETELAESDTSDTDPDESDASEQPPFLSNQY